MKTILIAAHAISGAVDGKPWTIAPGTEITTALSESLGLSEAEVVDLEARGAIAPEKARSGDLDAQLAAALERAEAAEARVAELEKQLETAKPAKG